jgi:hypothetical protein
MSQDEQFLRIMDNVAKSAQTAITDANVRLAHSEPVPAVFLDFMERMEVAMTFAKEQLRSGV